MSNTWLRRHTQRSKAQKVVADNSDGWREKGSREFL